MLINTFRFCLLKYPDNKLINKHHLDLYLDTFCIVSGLSNNNVINLQPYSPKPFCHKVTSAT